MYTVFSGTKNRRFSKTVPRVKLFIKKRRLIVFSTWTDENGCFWIRWYHTSYSASPVRDDTVVPFFWHFRVDERKRFVIRCVQNEKRIFFENGEKNPSFKISGYVWTRLTLSGLRPASYLGRFALSELPEEAWNRVRSRELSRQAWQVTSHPKSPRTTGNEAGLRQEIIIGRRGSAGALAVISLLQKSNF